MIAVTLPGGARRTLGPTFAVLAALGDVARGAEAPSEYAALLGLSAVLDDEDTPLSVDTVTAAVQQARIWLGDHEDAAPRTRAVVEAIAGLGDGARAKHYGPGDHPSGSSQQAHDGEGGGGAGEDEAGPLPPTDNDPPDGYVRIYRGVNPERNVVDADDPTHGEWYTSSYDEAVSYANWDYDGAGELGPGRAILAVDVPLARAREYARAGSRHRPVGNRDDDDAWDEEIFSEYGVEMRVDEDAMEMARVIEGDLQEGERGRGRQRKHWKSQTIARGAGPASKHKGYPEFNQDQPRDDSGKWSGNGGSGGISVEEVGPASAFKYGTLEPDDQEHFYHVTTQPALRRILREGLVPDRKPTMAEGAYRSASAGKIFVTDRQGVAYWRDRIEEHLEHSRDNPPKLFVVRLQRSAVFVRPDPNRSPSDANSWIIEPQGDVAKHAGLGLIVKASAPSPLLRLADRLEPIVRDAFLRAVRASRTRVDLADLAARVVRGELTPAQAVRQLDFAAALLHERLDPAIREAFVRGGAWAARDLSRFNLSMAFDAQRPAVAAWMRDQAGTRITEIGQQTLDAVREVLTSAAEAPVGPEGRPARDVARRLRDVLGLRSDQLAALGRYRAALEAEGLDADVIEARAARYGAMLLRQRSDLVARTEVMEALHASSAQAWQQAREDGLLPMDDTLIERVWIVTPDDRLCPECAPMDGVTAEGLDAYFVHPETGEAVEGPPLHPACRCDRGLRSTIGREAEPVLSVAAVPPPVRKYSPDQPRVPSGSPEGGQFAESGGGREGGGGVSVVVDGNDAARHARESSPAFRAWFRDSKVVDDKGQPLVVYHGTVGDFSRFEHGDIGFHFGTIEQAHDIIRARGGEPANVMPVYLSIQNPLRFGEMGSSWDAPVAWFMTLSRRVHDEPQLKPLLRIAEKHRESVEEHYGVAPFDDYPPLVAAKKAFASEMRDALQRLGYDGIVYRNLFEGSRNDDSWIAFRSSQIKSALGNVGTFDPTSPDITKAPSVAAMPAWLTWVKYSPDQPREPAGTPEGGQFAESGGGGAVGTGSADVTPDDVKVAFRELEDAQRGAPEAAMLAVQRYHGGGVLSFVVEHVGDLTNRFAKAALFGSDMSGDKIDKTLRTLSHRYGFAREHEENIRNNAKMLGRTEEEHARQIDALLSEYAKAHEQLTVYNRVQHLAKRAAVALGEQRWSQAALILSDLKGLRDNRDDDAWVAMLLEHRRDAGGKLIPYDPREPWRPTKHAAPTWLAWVTKYREDQAREPAGSPEGGRFADEGKGEDDVATIARGVDLRGNAERMIAAAGADPKAIESLAAELRDVPMMHATTAEAAVAILSSRSGIESRASVEDDIDVLKADWADQLRNLIDSLGEEDADEADRLEDTLNQLLRAKTFDGELASSLTSDVLVAAHAGDEMEMEHHERLAPILGKTLEADRAIGLDRYVFGGLGPHEPWYDYGRVLLVIDPRELDREGAFATPNDIVVGAKLAPGGAYHPDHVARYQRSMIAGRDLAKTAASADLSTASMPPPGPHRRRYEDGDKVRPGQWEVKVPNNVPHRAILGVIVTDQDDWDRLRDVLPDDKVHYLPSDASNFEGRARARGAHFVRHGKWPETEDGYRSPVDPQEPRR